MARPAIRSFSQHAKGYDSQRQLLIPCLQELYETAAELVGLRDGEVKRVLDLGAGTGLLSEQIALRHPDARIVLLDGAREMLQVAVSRFGARHVEIHHQDLRESLPDGPFDAIVSALAIHHLEDEDKRNLLTRAYLRLRPGGVFVNAEQVAGPTEWLDRAYQLRWREQCLRLGASQHQLTSAEERMSHDLCVDVQTQIDWMRQIGFLDSDCLQKSWRFAVIAGWRPGD